MTGNACGFVFPFENPPTKLKLLFHIKSIKFAKSAVFGQNIWLYVRTNNVIYCASKRLEFCRDTIDYQIYTKSNILKLNPICNHAQRTPIQV